MKNAKSVFRLLNLSSHGLFPNPYFLILSSYLLFLIFSCSKDSTKPETITISGTVTLDGQTDNSGVTVRLYRPVAMDAQLKAIIQQYPQIGPQNSQLSGFNHLAKSAVYSATTAANGSWSVNDVTAGEYNVVVEKQGYGWRYASVNTSGGTVSMQLDSARNIAGNMTGANVQFNNSFNNVTSNALFDGQSQLQFSGQNHIYFTASNLTVTIQGSISGLNGGATLYITTAPNVNNCELVFKNINNLNLQALQTNGSVQVTINNCQLNLRNSIIENPASIGMRISTSQGDISNCLFQNSSFGLSSDESTLPLVEHNIFFNNTNDIECFFLDSTLFKNNVFANSNENLKLVRCNLKIENNEFKNSIANIQLSDISTIVIKKNQFNANTNNIRLNNVSHISNVIGLTANLNNFIDTQEYIFFLEGGTAIDTVDATSNYWGSIVSTEIASKIHDRTDNPVYNKRQVVEFAPYSFQANTAGILP